MTMGVIRHAPLLFGLRTLSLKTMLTAATLLLCLASSRGQPVPSTPALDADAAYAEALRIFDHMDMQRAKNYDTLLQQLQVAADRGHRDASILVEALKSTDAADRLNRLKPLANAGNVIAETFVGSSFSTGPQADFALALRLLKSAAAKPLGGADAQLELAGMYSRGDGIPANELVARRLAKKAAAAGNPEAQRVVNQVEGEDAKQRADAATCGRKAAAECSSMAPTAQPVCILLAQRRLGC